MRTFILSSAVLLAVTANAQTATTTASADGAAPPLIKNVEANPNDSPMVRAAKRAVKARQNPTQRRVVSLSGSNVATRGRVAVSSGPVEGPRALPPISDAKQVPPPKAVTPAEMAAQVRQELMAKLQKLDAEEKRIGTEVDEPYGHDMDEDDVEQRLAQIAEERKKLETVLRTIPPQ